jgi:hypothetical protein
LNLGIYQDFYALNYWNESFGFFSLCGSTSLNVIGLFFALIADYHALRRIKRKLILEYEKLEMTKTPSKSLDISQDLSGDFSHTNDYFDGTKIH